MPEPWISCLGLQLRSARREGFSRLRRIMKRSDLLSNAAPLVTSSPRNHVYPIAERVRRLFTLLGATSPPLDTPLTAPSFLSRATHQVKTQSEAKPSPIPIAAPAMTSVR
jgi:hypothetical protein